MTAVESFILGIFVGVFVGVFLVSVLTMAREPGP